MARFFNAASFGTWGRNLVVTVDHHTKDENSVTPPPDTNLFNLTIFDDPAKFLDSTKQGGSGARETFLNVSRDANSARFVGKILAEQSSLVRVATVGSARPAAAAVPATATSGHDGVSATAQNAAAAEVEGSETDKTGIYALLKADIFNLLCIPPLTIVTAPSTVPNTVVDVPIASTWEKASKLCEDRRALLIVDAPRSWTLNSASADYPAKKVGDFSAIVRKNAALYFPTVRIPDPLQEGGLDDFAPCGIVAGVMSRTDAERGIWKAPAGIDASMRGVVGTSVLGVPVAMNDKENGDFNPLGINCLRSFPNVGHVVWGARTLRRRRCAGVRMEVRAGAPVRAFYRRESLPWHAVGRVRAERRTLVGADSAESWRLHAQPISAGRVSGQDAAGSLFREMRQRDDDPERHQSAASSISSSVLRRSNQPSS